MFLQVCVILSTGGGYLTRYTPPETRYTPPGPGTPPRTRHTPLDQVHPPDQAHTPPDQVHPPPPGTRYTPPGPGTPPRPGTPWDQVHPPGPGTPPQTRYTPGDQVHPPGIREIRSTCGRYTSYWNAFLFIDYFLLRNLNYIKLYFYRPQTKFGVR